MSESEESSSEHTGSSHSGSSPSHSSVAWWRSPERLIAVIGAIALRYGGKLPEIETAAVLMVALGAPVTSAVVKFIQAHRKR